jgi:hypothetical protein
MLFPRAKALGFPRNPFRIAGRFAADVAGVGIAGILPPSGRQDDKRSLYAYICSAYLKGLRWPLVQK